MTTDRSAPPRDATRPRPRPRPPGAHRVEGPKPGNGASPIAALDETPANGVAVGPAASDTAADESDGSAAHRPSAEGAGNYTNFLDELYIAQRKTPRRVSRIPRLVLEASRLVWQTSRLQTSAIMSAQVVIAGFAALQVLLGGIAVRELLKVQDGVSLSHLVVPLLLLAVVSTAGGLSTQGSSQFGRLLGARVQRTVTGRVLDVASDVELITYDDSRFYDQLSRVLANVPTRPFSVVTCLAALVGGGAGVIALTVSLLVIQPVLVPILLIGGIPLWYLSRKGGRLEFDFAVSQTAAMRERDYMELTLTRREAAAELRAYSTSAPLRQRWEDLYESFLTALRRQVRRRYALSAATGLASGAVTILTLLILIELIRHGSVGFAQAASAAVAIRLLSGRLQQLIGGLSTLFESALFLEDYDEFLGRQPTRRPQPDPAAVPEPFRGLSVTDVAFRYPQADRDALQGVSLELRPGEIVALVGENGSGKTTLAKIMAGLYEPRAGHVTLNGTVVRERDKVRDQVALVLQDFTHYALSAAENIAFGRPEIPADEQRIRAAARHVGADEFLAQMPDGYATRLSKVFKDGRELSLGQWQRVALARAFYRNAPIVVLDEPTAALDPRAEARLYDSVRSVLAGRTVVLITHRLASVRGADRIVVLNQGSVAEQGTHEELLRAGGLYAELVSLQTNRHIGSVDRLDPATTERIAT